LAASAISDNLKDREAATFAAPEPATPASRNRSSPVNGTSATISELMSGS
jgi:hypothetical protein